MTTPEPEQPAPAGTAPAPPLYPGGPAYSAPDEDAPPAKRPVKVLDVVITIVLLVADGVLAGLASVTGMFLVMASDPCGNLTCDGSLIAIGWMMGMILPWVAFAITVVVAVILMVKRRLAFWVPLAGAVLIVLSLLLAFVVTAAGVPSSGA
ncbi:DUF6264 family protein [Microbacterium trichothecenolyticum]|uniref:DUF6264 family protein n=1 Tax=Microbacterium trichothecenolyticum TaxID=69370 RepID=UPI0035BE93CD